MHLQKVVISPQVKNFLSVKALFTHTHTHINGNIAGINKEEKSFYPPGSRTRAFACDTVLTITDRVQKSLESRSKARVVGVDFSAAFDKVNHKKLI